MIYELRIYRCLPNRLPALLKRFETKTLRIWEKHGIRQAGFWTTVIGESESDFTYLLAWESLAEREKKWAAFQTIPSGSPRETRARRTGPCATLSNSILQPTSFSSVRSASVLVGAQPQAVRPRTMRTIQINMQAPMKPRIR